MQASETMDFAPGSKIGRYRAEEKVGSGGFGDVTESGIVLSEAATEVENSTGMQKIEPAVEAELRATYQGLTIEELRNLLKDPGLKGYAIPFIKALLKKRSPEGSD